MENHFKLYLYNQDGSDMFFVLVSMFKGTTYSDIPREEFTKLGNTDPTLNIEWSYQGMKEFRDLSIGELRVLIDLFGLKELL